MGMAAKEVALKALEISEYLALGIRRPFIILNT
jgi:hypothetical protein